MRNLLKLNTRRRKAQFFVLSAFAIVSILYLLSSWIQPYTILDTSSVVLQQGPFIFNNLKEKAIETVNISKTCTDLMYDLDEYNNFITSYASSQNINLNFTYNISQITIPNCQIPSGSQIVIPMNLTLKSTNAFIASNFTATWTAP